MCFIVLKDQSDIQGRPSLHSSNTGRKIPLEHDNSPFLCCPHPITAGNPLLRRASHLPKQVCSSGHQPSCRQPFQLADFTSYVCNFSSLTYDSTPNTLHQTNSKYSWLHCTLSIYKLTHVFVIVLSCFYLYCIACQINSFCFISCYRYYI